MSRKRTVLGIERILDAATAKRADDNIVPELSHDISQNNGICTENPINVVERRNTLKEIAEDFHGEEDLKDLGAKLELVVNEIDARRALAAQVIEEIEAERHRYRPKKPH